MEFKYMLENWNGMAVLQITKMPEELRNKGDIYTCKNGWKICSVSSPEIINLEKKIYIQGSCKRLDYKICCAEWSDEIPAALEEFQQWCERKYGLRSKFTDEQLDSLRTLRKLLDGADYIAMDGDGQWRVYSIKPTRRSDYNGWAPYYLASKFCTSENTLPTDIPWEESLFDLDELLEE